MRWKFLLNLFGGQSNIYFSFPTADNQRVCLYPAALFKNTEIKKNGVGGALLGAEGQGRPGQVHVLSFICSEHSDEKCKY